jgi:hypothetical protein
MRACGFQFRRESERWDNDQQRAVRSAVMQRASGGENAVPTVTAVTQLANHQRPSHHKKSIKIDLKIQLPHFNPSLTLRSTEDLRILN